MVIRYRQTRGCSARRRMPQDKHHQHCQLLVQATKFDHNSVAFQPHFRCVVLKVIFSNVQNDFSLDRYLAERTRCIGRPKTGSGCKQMFWRQILQNTSARAWIQIAGVGFSLRCIALLLDAVRQLSCLHRNNNSNLFVLSSATSGLPKHY